MTAIKDKKHNTLVLLGYIIYSLAILSVSTLLVIDPIGLNAKVLILPLIVVLLASSAIFSYQIATKSSNLSKALFIAGTIALSILFTMIGFFIVAGIAWLVALSHV